MNQARNFYPIARDRIATYFLWQHTLSIAAFGLFTFGAGFVAALIYAASIGTWLTIKQSENLQYWLEGSTLRVDSGVYFLKRKSIPLDRVTDFVLVQGPLLRWCNLWALRVQTAGFGGESRAEATLYGLNNPEEIRDELIRIRDQTSLRNSA